ncbi:MAG: bacillithiol biosynthesis cysteine-adding enzyme BshC [Flavobacteriaceae bacterium]|nr:bacillithiol biosynthesis cysteine-adding enzyme BshC [Flavobacteriaceae bacterium]
MPTECIPFRETGYFSNLICDYLDQHERIQPFYHRFPTIENFQGQIQEKKEAFSKDYRKVLVDTLLSQYKNIDASNLTQSNIEKLLNTNTFTITTGHQLNLFTGPLYFLYKIISTINLCEELKVAYPENDFVPIYWMASEDHDFEEISYFNFKGKKVSWERGFGGAVGELLTEGLEEVFNIFSKELGLGKSATFLKQLFQDSYIKHNNLSEATRYLANELFKDYGLVIVEANDNSLKQLFAPYVKRELTEEVSFSEVSKTIAKFPEGIPVQVNPREINLFYLTEGLRERIIKTGTGYEINNTNIVFTEEEMNAELASYPERFSPNALLRPFYQEVILPNLCYIGGGGELAYWFELKSTFENFGVPFPILLLRNSVLLISEQQHKKMEKLDLSLQDVFLKQQELLVQKTKALSAITIDFKEQKNHLENQFKVLHDLAEQTDASFKGAVAAQERKQIKGLEHLEKRLLKAQKRVLSEKLLLITTLQDQLFPKQSLQERQMNFSEFYLEHGQELVTKLAKELKPLSGEFTCIYL